MPCAPLPPEPLAGRQQAAARRAVAALIGHHTQVDGNDAKDIVQLVLERWFRYRGRFDEVGPASIETYIWKIAENVVRDLARREKAAKRGGGLAPLSLDRPLSDTSDTTLGDITPDRSSTEALGKAMDHELLRQAIAGFRSRLAPRDRAILDAFKGAPNLSAVAERLGLPRSTVYGWLDRIRQQAENAGLRDFLS